MSERRGSGGRGGSTGSSARGGGTGRGGESGAGGGRAGAGRAAGRGLPGRQGSAGSQRADTGAGRTDAAARRADAGTARSAAAGRTGTGRTAAGKTGAARTGSGTRTGTGGTGAGRTGAARSAAAGRTGAGARSTAAGRTGAGRAGAGRVGAARTGAATGSLPAHRSGDPVTGRRMPRRAAGTEAGEQVEGRQAVRELLRARRRAVHSVTVADSSERSGLLDEIIALAGEAGVPVRRVGRDRIDGLAETEAPQGVVASAEPLAEAELTSLATARPGGPPPFLVVLDGVTDPHNVGAVMRSALCAGATGLVVARHRAAHLGPTAVKAAAGAAEWLPVAVVAGIPGALSELQTAGVWTVGLDADGSTTVWDIGVATEPVALVLGAEGDGLARLTRQRCEVVISVPMQGPLASLNVSAAAALGCFEVARRRTAAAPPD